MNGNGKLGRTRPWALLALAVALACGLFSASSALAKEPPQPPQLPGAWEVVILHPIGDYGTSAGRGASGAQQVGGVYVYDLGSAHASLWNGTAESWVDLNPPGADESYAHGTSDGQQAGYATSTVGDNQETHAALWNGTAASWVDLHPAGASSSHALGIGDGEQVGMVDWRHASLWRGTAESWVDLHPFDPAWTESWAWGVSGGQQVGFVARDELRYDPYYGEYYWVRICHASLWSGAPESWVDLNPDKALDSWAYDVSDGQQVGYATVWSKLERNWATHAGMWSGKAKSWVDLHPSGYLGSEARGVSHGYQAGIAWTSYHPDWWYLSHAGLWSGTPESWVDLHDLLPANYEVSEAWDIEVTETDIWVVGSAFDPNVPWPWTHAVLWHKTLSE